MPSFADQLRRLQVARDTERIPRDLAAWVLDELAARSRDVERLDARNALLREAGVILGGSTWARAARLRAEILAAERRRTPAGAVAELVAEALELDPDCPRSVRQLLRVLGDTEGGCDVTTARVQDGGR